MANITGLSPDEQKAIDYYAETLKNALAPSQETATSQVRGEVASKFGGGSTPLEAQLVGDALAKFQNVQAQQVGEALLRFLLQHGQEQTALAQIAGAMAQEQERSMAAAAARKWQEDMAAKYAQTIATKTGLEQAAFAGGLSPFGNANLPKTSPGSIKSDSERRAELLGFPIKSNQSVSSNSGISSGAIPPAGVSDLYNPFTGYDPMLGVPEVWGGGFSG